MNIIATKFDARYHWKEFRAVTMEGMDGIAGLGDHGRYLNVISTSDLIESEYLYNGLPNVPKRTGELDRLPTVDYQTSAPVYYEQEMYGYQYVYTRRAARYDRTGKIVDVASSMGEASADSIEWLAADILNGSTVNTGGIDGKALAATDHLDVDGATTYSNILTPGGATTAFLQTVYNYQKRGITNSNGRVIQPRIKGIEVAPERVPSFRRLLQAVEAGQPNPAVQNEYREILTPDQIYGNVRLTGTYDVHIIFEGHHLNMFVAENPRTRTWNDDELEAIHHGIQFELIVGWTDARRYAFMSGQG